MDELLQQLADETGIPVDMLERSVNARAGATGKTPDAVVAEWAGAPAPEVGSAPPVAAAAPPAAPAAAEEPAAPPAEAPSLEVEVLEPVAAAEGADATPEDDLDLEPEPVAAGPGLPRWLSAAFVIVPFIAVLYALSVPNGPDCGNAGRLEVDPVTGIAVNCDLTEYGSEEVNFFSLGASLYDANCAACHGATGGGGAGPALAAGAVVSTFGSCSDHIEWVTLGSAAWPDSTYGDGGTSVAGGMPGFSAILSETELAATVLYERVAFGNVELATAETGCGLLAAGAEE